MNAATANALESNLAAGNASGASGLGEAVAAAARPEWHEPFCSRYAHLLFEYGHWFLLAALIIGTIGALAAIAKLFSAKGDGDEAGGGILQTAVSALTALIDSLAKAPTWIAMLGAALALFWMSGHALPGMCEGVSDPVENNSASAAEDGSDSNQSAANASAENENGG